MERMIHSVYAIGGQRSATTSEIPSVGYNFNFRLKVLLGCSVIYFLTSQPDSLQ